VNPWNVESEKPPYKVRLGRIPLYDPPPPSRVHWLRTSHFHLQICTDCLTTVAVSRAPAFAGNEISSVTTNSLAHLTRLLDYPDPRYKQDIAL